MPKNFRFWSNVALIALTHVAIIIGLIRWSRAEKETGAQSVIWMSGGGGDGLIPKKRNPLPPKESKTEPMKDRDTEEDQPFLTSARSEIQLSTPKPSPTATATPERSPKANPTPNIKGTPTSTPKPKPKPTPKPSPKKIVLAKASPKPSAKPTSEKVEKPQMEEESEKKELAKEDSIEKEQPKPSVATQTGSGRSPTSGTGSGRSGGSANASQFSWYGSMLHDRFYSEWVQPTDVATTAEKNSVLVKLRIEKDGRISSFEVVRSSGNSALDESVKALANRVSHVEPLPDGLGKGDHYDVKINFELNSE